MILLLLGDDSAASFAQRARSPPGTPPIFFRPEVQRNGASLTHATEAINFTGDFTVSNIAQVARIDLDIDQHLMNLMNNAPEANPLQLRDDRFIMLDDSNDGRGEPWADVLTSVTTRRRNGRTRWTRQRRFRQRKLMPTWDSITGKLAPTWDEITGKDAARPSAAEIMAGYGDDPSAIRDARCSGRHPHS